MFSMTSSDLISQYQYICSHRCTGHFSYPANGMITNVLCWCVQQRLVLVCLTKCLVLVSSTTLQSYISHMSGRIYCNWRVMLPSFLTFHSFYFAFIHNSCTSHQSLYMQSMDTGYAIIVSLITANGVWDCFFTSPTASRSRHQLICISTYYISLWATCSTISDF